MITLFKALVKYHRKCFTMEDLIRLSLKEPKFFVKQKRWYDLLDRPIEDPRFLKITLEDWNNWTLKTFNDLLDFLEFPKYNRVLIAPCKFLVPHTIISPQIDTELIRNFEAYSDSHITKDTPIEKQIKEIRERG